MERGFSGEAALQLMELLLIQLSDRGVLSPADLDEIFGAAMDAQMKGVQANPDPRHALIYQLVRQVQASCRAAQPG